MSAFSNPPTTDDPTAPAQPEPPTAEAASGPSDELLAALHALAQQVRLSLLVELGRREAICVSDLAATQPRDSATISRHLNTLGRAGLVRFQQRGQQRFYSLERDGLRRVLGELGELLGL